MNDYLFDKTGDDPQVAELEGLLGVYAHRAPLREPPPRRPRRRWTAVMAVTGAIAVAAVIALVLWRRGDTGDAIAASCTSSGAAGFAFAVAGGPARCDGDTASRGTLPVGAWLETSGGAVADVRVADIGELTVFGDSRLRLVETGDREHRMELARGKVAARVVAPPRLFVVDTPGAKAVDLGCAYELTVEPGGRTHLKVTSGTVSLEGRGVTAYVPVDVEVYAVPGRGPGTPIAFTASRPLRDAVERFDRGDATALPAIVEAAGRGDTITLWNLLARTTGADRAAVARRLDALAARPASVRLDDVIAGDRDALERWREELDITWSCPDCGLGPEH